MKTITLQNSKRFFFRLMFIFAFMGTSLSTYAATVYLKNGHDGIWETISNWVTTSGGSTAYGSLPQPGDNVVIPSSVSGTNLTLSIKSAVTINQLDLSKLTLNIQSGSFTVNHATLGVNANTPAVKISAGGIVNQATMTVIGNTNAANFAYSTSAPTTQLSYNLIDLENSGTSTTNSTFENQTGATLTLDHSGFLATNGNTSGTAFNPIFFYIGQTVATTTPTIILNGTINLIQKTYQAQSATQPGYKQIVFKCATGTKTIIDGTFTIGTPTAPFVGVNLILCNSGVALTNSLTFASTANITFNAEMGSGDTFGQMCSFNGLVTNDGNITFNAPAPGAPYTNGVYQYLYGLAGLTNTGTMNFTGKITNKAINFNSGITTNVPIYSFNNYGTINVNSTGVCNGIGSYQGSNSGTYPTPTGVNAVYQLTNMGTLNLYSTNTSSGSINMGNNDPNSWFKNTGYINTNGLIASGFANSIKGTTDSLRYVESPASTSMKFYNSGIVNFDLPANTSKAISFLKIPDFGTKDPKLNYAIVNFINALDGIGGTVTGRGIFLAGSLNNSTGTLSPGCGTTTMTYTPSTSFTTPQVDAANIGQFDIQGVSVALTGKASMDVNGATAATTGYDQIINSTASAVLGVAGVSLSVMNGGGYTPTSGTTFDLFKATDAAGTCTGPFASTLIPSPFSNWSVGYTATTANVSYNNINGVESFYDKLVSVSPNPFNNSFSIESDKVVKNVMIINTLGKTVLSIPANSTLVKVNNLQLSPGFYFVKANIEGTWTTNKMCKQ